MTTTWEDLVAMAIQGTARRAPDRTAWLVDLGEPAAALGGEPTDYVLDAAALATVARRAGLTTVWAATATDAAPPDDRPTVSGAALNLIVDEPDLAERLVTRAHRLGLGVPAPWLPWLLSVGARSNIDREAVVAVAGPRGRWLADRNPDWASLYQRAPEVDGYDDRPWREGVVDERLDWLRRLRASDIEASQAYVAEALAPRGESAAVKQAVIALLTELPQAADEALLEACLDARAVDVRGAAQQALARRPGSAYCQRMLARFRAWIHVKRQPLQFGFTVPGILDATATRDGLTTGTPGRTSTPEQHLLHVLVAIPLSEWATWGTPGHLVSAEIEERFRPTARYAWGYRAVVERDRAWATALLQQGDEGLRHLLAPLARLLPESVRDELTRSILPLLLVPGGPRPFAVEWLAQVPFPLPDDVCAAVINGLPGLARLQHAGRVADALVKRIGSEQPTNRADELAAIAHLVPPQVARSVHEAIHRHTVRARLDALLVADARAGSPTDTNQPDQLRRADGRQDRQRTDEEPL